MRALASVTELAATSRDVGAILDGAIEPGIVAESTAADTGVAQVEAARGLLLHRVALDGKRIEDYRVVAPTEWNFHADGAVAEGLAAMTSTDREVALQQADLFLTLMDPCVRWSLEIH